MISWLLGLDIAMRNEPTHPPGFRKVHRHAIEWCGLLIRGCFAKVKLDRKHSYKQEKPSSLSLRARSSSCNMYEYSLRSIKVN